VNFWLSVARSRVRSGADQCTSDDGSIAQDHSDQSSYASLLAITLHALQFNANAATTESA
jgi:hypothetical protein